jgi:hypothetical protein
MAEAAVGEAVAKKRRGSDKSKGGRGLGGLVV